MQRMFSFLNIVNESLLDVFNTLFIGFLVDFNQVFCVFLRQFVDVTIIN